MTVDEHGIIWVPAHEVQAGDVLKGGSTITSTRRVDYRGGSFVQIEHEQGSLGLAPHVNVALRSVVTD